jgi:hypothetical protein
MRVVAMLAGAIVVVFAASLVAPWDPDAGGGWGPVFALAVATVAAIVEGRVGRRWRGVAAGAGVGFVALAAYSAGTYIAYDLELRSLSWSDWGDQNYPVSLLLLTILLYGIPAAVVGAILAELGRVSRRLL